MSSSTPRPRLPGRATHAEHQAAVARRLDLLRAQLAAPVPADEPVSGAVAEPAVAWEPEPAAGEVTGDEWWADATRVRPAVRAAVGEPAAGPEEPSALPAALAAAGAVPLPGRHAARRRRAGPADLVPEPLRGRFALGPSQLSVVAVVVAIGLAVTAWTVVRSRPEPVAAPVAAPTSAAADDAALVVLDPAATGPDDPGAAGAPVGATEAGTSTSTTTSTATSTGGAPAAGQGEVTVDVAGKVRRPGIAVLAAGARVVDAIEAAGGARDGVDLTSLNLARPLVDGEQVLVGVDPPPGVAASLVGTAPTAPGTGAELEGGALVDLNAATEAQLDTLPEVGPVTAQSIIAWREQHGGFSAVDELLEVDGIGETTLARIAPHVTV